MKEPMSYFRLSTIISACVTALIASALGFVSYVLIPDRFPIRLQALPVVVATSTSPIPTIVPKVIAHLKTPVPVRAIYMTACVASLSKWRTQLAELIDETELNAVIIDVKDYTGTISIPSSDPLLIGTSGTGCKVPDMEEFLAFLHEKGIYTIARIAVFQDPLYVKHYPEYAVKTKTDKKVIWRDRKGLPFIDVGATPYWDYIVRLGNASYDIGFDELNFDYIRFPSDGNMKDVYYEWSNATITANQVNGRSLVVNEFFKHIHAAFASTSVKTSADLFGMTATNYDDLSIGQILEHAAASFDFVAPMVYPSHYPKGFLGFDDVNKHPYEIVKYSMDKAVSRLVAASTTPSKLRPWLQDNNYPVVYTAAMVRAQIQATYDAGLDSWMLWDPANRYTREALLDADAETGESL